MTDTIIKAGTTLTRVTGTNTQGTGRIIQKDLLPCGHSGIRVHCTCALRDVQCRRCRRVWVAVGKEWFEVEDPHKKEAKPMP